MNRTFDDQSDNHGNIDAATGPYAALLLRVSLGVMFLSHGVILKWMTFTPAGTAQFFESIGIPGFAAYLVIGAETIGGIAMILGFQTRLVALALLPILLGAAMTHAGNGWVFSAQGGGWEYPAYLIAASVAQVLLGGGAHAVSNDANVTQAVRRMLQRVPA